jgi:hypothetical protein
MGSLLQILQFIQIFNALLPVAKTGITTIDSLIPNAPGATKLAAVKVMLQGAFAQFDHAVIEFEHLWAALTPIINSMVAVAQAEGVLTAKVAGNVTAIQAKVEAATQVADALSSTLNPASAAK